MKLLNLGCGGQRVQSPEWVNLDDLYAQLEPGTGARTQLNAEPNYINHKIDPQGRLPFDDDTFDGILASHFFEHFDAQECLGIMRECRRILKPGGYILASVPDASYFRVVHPDDRNENWQRLFGVTDVNNPIPTWMQAALFFEQHKQVLTEDALWCLFRQAGLGSFKLGMTRIEEDSEIVKTMMGQLNRRAFSLEMLASKP